MGEDGYVSAIDGFLWPQQELEHLEQLGYTAAERDFIWTEIMGHG